MTICGSAVEVGIGDKDTTQKHSSMSEQPESEFVTMILLKRLRNLMWIHCQNNNIKPSNNFHQINCCDMHCQVLIEITLKKDHNYPKPNYRIPFEVDIECSPQGPQDSKEFWEDCILGCRVSPVFEPGGSRNVIVDVPYSIGYHEHDEMPRVIVDYPPDLNDVDFRGWKVYINYVNGWSDSDSDESSTPDSVS